MNKTEFSWFRLYSTTGLGPKSLLVIFKTIQQSNLPVEKIFDMTRDEFFYRFPRLKRSTFDELQNCNADKADREFRELKAEGVQVIYPTCDNYPDKLLEFAETHSISPILFCKGKVGLLNSEGVAIVGSRNATDKGLWIARQLAFELARQGKNVISGYAKGIDTSAHLGALQAEGTTTIVLSSGIFEFSRKRDFKGLSPRWEQDVLVVSQFPPKEKWSARNAMIRNKLVCGLSRAVVVVESGKEKDKEGKMSGTFHAAKTAMEMRIPLFVFSSSCFEKLPLGNQDLIERGGIEITEQNSAQEILKWIDGKGHSESNQMTEKFSEAIQLSLF